VTLFLSRLHFPVTTLGPGRRIGLWFQGCTIRCPGCISVDTWQTGQGETELSAVLQELGRLAPDADGLTVSGGEPFEQPDALAAILHAWRSMSDRDVLVFTGHHMETISPWLSAHPGLIDALVTGPFRSDLPQTLALRGSDNQDLQVLTAAGASFLAYDRPSNSSDRRLDVMFDAAGAAWIAGIPARGDLARLRRVISAAGHHIETSDALGNLPS
jgi:anaerobic ribonucleoside-triphosphate reductase activating protein